MVIFVWQFFHTSRHDAEEFGGSGVVNVGSVIAEDTPWNGRPVSAQLRVPPLGAVWLAPASQVR